LLPRISIARNYDTSIEKNYILIGKSAAMKNVRQQIIKMAPVEKTVLITGESGTGKELAARALHQFSQRAKGPWITVNSAALPASLVQSELFGYERGAFTGANRFKMGKIEAANEGTILLDEIGDIAPDVQIALLRFLQEKTIERLGSTESIGLNVRVIAATHRDLKRAVAEGTFREDLYYRLNTLHLQMPPLREREDDIIDLAYCFLEKFLREQNKSKPRDFSIEALRVMRVHNWPGNVRELINRVERAVLFCDDRLIAPKHLDLDRRSNSRQVVTIEEARKRAEHDAIHIAIQHANGNLTRAAKVLGISRASLYRLCKFNVEMNEKNQAHRKIRK
jgi:DNA-binding NtrC family response regulator